MRMYYRRQALARWPAGKVHIASGPGGVRAASLTEVHSESEGRDPRSFEFAEGLLP